MGAQPRLIESHAQNSVGVAVHVPPATVGRVIVDAKASYLVLYSPSGKLTVMDKEGME